jgi:hypothetical protein
MLAVIPRLISEVSREVVSKEHWKRDEEKGREYRASIRPFDTDDFAQECAAIRLANPGLPSKAVWSAARNALRHPQPISIELVFGLQAKPASECIAD